MGGNGAPGANRGDPVMRRIPDRARGLFERLGPGQADIGQEMVIQVTQIPPLAGQTEVLSDPSKHYAASLMNCGV